MKQKQKYSAWRGGYLSGSGDNHDERITNERITFSSAASVAHAQARARGPSITSSGAFKIGGGKTRRAIRAGGSGASVVPAVQAGMGGNRRKDAERARHALCLSVLPGLAPCPGARARVPQIAARAVGQVPAGGRISSGESAEAGPIGNPNQR